VVLAASGSAGVVVAEATGITRHDDGVAIDTVSTPMVGRVVEIRELADLIGLGDRAHGAVLLGGDAGAGKSRLVTELSARVASVGWQVLVGHCLDFGDSSAPYLPFSEAFGRLADDDPAIVESLAMSYPAIVGLLPSHRMLSDTGTAAVPTGQAALFDAVHGALSQLSERAPLLLIIEDLHWADQSTRDLLRFLFSRQFTSETAILATYRSDDLHRRHPLRAELAEWVRLPTVERLQLGPLDDTDARRLVRQLHPQTLPKREVQHIVARAEGNPFFIEELVAATEVSGGRLPTDLADLLLVRLDQIGDDGRQAVRAASVAGRHVSHALLALGTDLSEDALEAALRAAVEANILIAVGDDGYAFRHALLAEAIYEDLLPGERVRLHAAYAKALAAHRAEGSAAELSRHARASHDLVTATQASIQAGDEAMAVGGPEEAIRHYELALELLSDPGVAAAVRTAEGEEVDRIGLVIKASGAASAAGHLFRAVALAYDQLRALPADAPAQDRVRLIVAVVTAGLLTDNKIDLLSLTTEATRLMADEPPSELRAQVLTLHARANADRARDDEAARWAGEALQIAQDLDLPKVATDSRILLARLDDRAGDPQSAEVVLSTAVEEARAAGETQAELRGIYVLASLHYEQGRLSDALELFQEAALRASALGWQWAPYGLDSVFFGAIVALATGQWTLAGEMLDIPGQSPPELADALLGSIRLQIAAGRGDLNALADLPRIRDRWQLDGLIAITSGAAAIELLGQAGDLREAQRIHDDVIEVVSGLWQRPTFLAQVRLAALELGMLSKAAGAATVPEREALVARGDQIAAAAGVAAAAARHPGPESIAWAMRVGAELARLHWQAGVDPATEQTLVESWRATVAAFENFGHVHETARSRARLAAVLAASGHADDARAEVAAARVVATRLGAKPLLDELRSLSGGTPSPAHARNADALTAREREVLAQVATGRSNREIAQHLFISAKTVSVHISNVLAKLDASSRTEAVAIARRRHLLDETA
jgi:DNA-binding CsgD family transcriptional regulator/tetratricopeptide (TPR) repeat protein